MVSAKLINGMVTQRHSHCITVASVCPYHGRFDVHVYIRQWVLEQIIIDGIAIFPDIRQRF